MIARTCANCGALISDATATACPQCGIELAGAIPSIYPPLSDLAPPPPPNAAIPAPTPLPPTLVPAREPVLPATLVPVGEPPLSTTLKRASQDDPPVFASALPLPPPALLLPSPALPSPREALPPPPIVALPAVPLSPPRLVVPLRTAAPVAPLPTRLSPPVVPLPAPPAYIPPARPMAPPARVAPAARGRIARAWLVTCGTIVFLVGVAFGLWRWLFAEQPPYSAAMQEILAIIYASHVVWHLPPSILAGIKPEDMPTTEALAYQLLGVWLAIIPVACAGAFWLAVRERQRGRHVGMWGDGFVVNLLVFLLGTVLLGAEEVAAQRLSGHSDLLHRHLLWAPALVVALPYALLMLLVLALGCSGAGTLLAALFARWRPTLPNPPASYRLIFLVALVCVAAVVCQAAILQAIIDPQFSNTAMSAFWYPVAAAIIVALAALATRGPTP